MTTARRRGDGLVAEVLRRRDEIEAVVPAWRELAVRCGKAFIGPEWFDALDLAAGVGAVVVVRRGTTVVGVLPLEIDGRAVRFAGSRFGDHFAPAARPEDVCDVAEVGAAAIAAHRPRHHVVLDRVDLGAAWVEAYRRGRSARTARTRLRCEQLPHVDLEGRTWSSWLGEQSRNFRGQVGRKERALVREHGAVHRAGGATREALAEDLEVFFRLHSARWADRPGRSALLDDGSRAFHHRFAARLHEHGWLRLRFLEIDGTAVASIYGWSLGGRWSYFNSGWDPAWAPQSVGFVLLAQCLREAFEEGAGTFDLLLGDEAYKARFASGERTVETVALTDPLSRARLAAGSEAGLRSALRALPPSIDRRVRGSYSVGRRVLARRSRSTIDGGLRN